MLCSERHVSTTRIEAVHAARQQQLALYPPSPPASVANSFDSSMDDITHARSSTRRPPVRPALEHLPPEVLDIIFSHLSTDPHGGRWSQVLALGRTCSKLCDEVNRYLYSNIRLESPRAFDKLVSTLLTCAGTIAPLVQSFTYVAPGEFTPRAPSGYLPSDLTPVLTHLPTILHLCPNIETLVLENINDITLKDWQHLFPASAVALKRIRFFKWSYYSGWRRGRNFSRAWFPVLASFKALHELSLANCVIDSEATSGVSVAAFLGVQKLELENICWSMSDMQSFAPLLPNVECLDMKTIKVFPYPTTAYHPLPPMFTKLRALSVDCASRILSPKHHICNFLAPSLRTSLEYLSLSGGCSLCPAFFKNLSIPTLYIHLSQLRVCGGFESTRDLNDVIVSYVDNCPNIERVDIEAPSMAIVDKDGHNLGGETDIGRRGSWVFVDIDFRLTEKEKILKAAREGEHSERSGLHSEEDEINRPMARTGSMRKHIIGIPEARLRELEHVYDDHRRREEESEAS
ncbi:hypothetical protein BZA70DRAFT_287864 [Myxozyma melibiosi]|uniref:F-box domain-containing protein n=1 Tax=Myxozyma melibiosi TaxID=54550 RepID=A0ABR1FFN2_9ASCO